MLMDHVLCTERRMVPLRRKRHTSELSQFEAATAYREPTMCQTLWWTWKNLFFAKVDGISKKVACIFGGGHSTLRIIYPAEGWYRSPEHSEGGCFLEYGVVPGTTILYSPLTLSTSHNGFWELLLSIWLHTPCFPQESCMIKWHSIFSAGWCQAQRHHHTEWAPRRLEGEQFPAREEWGCRGGRREGKAAPFHSARELLWVP